jgi:hypothetical protein
MQMQRWELPHADRGTRDERWRKLILITKPIGEKYFQLYDCLAKRSNMLKIYPMHHLLYREILYSLF